MGSIDVDGLYFDDEVEAKLAVKGLTIEDIQEVYDVAPRYYVNRPDRRASHVMVGATFEGVVLVVPIEKWGAGLWRPVTAFRPSASQEARYRSRP